MNTSSVFIFLEVLAIATLKDNLINEQIKCKEVMVIGPNGEQLGIKTRQDALTLAGYAGFDLVLMNCLLYTSPSPRDMRRSRMPSSA